MAELPENPGSVGSPAPQTGAQTPPPFQPVSVTYQPVASTVGGPPPAAPPSKSGGGSVLKIVLIVLGVIVVLVMLVVGVIGYGIWRVSRAVHVNTATGETTIHTQGGTFSANSTQTYTADELGTAIYPGAQPAKGGMRMNLPTGSMVEASYVTTDSKEQVVTFYKNKFGSQASTVDTDDGAIVTVTKSKQDSVIVTITQKPNESDGKTQIHILHTINTKAD